MTSSQTLAPIKFVDAWQDSRQLLFQDARGDDVGQVDVEAAHVEKDVALPALDAVVLVLDGGSEQLEPDDGFDAEQVGAEVRDLEAVHEPAQHDDDAGRAVAAAVDGEDEAAAQEKADEDAEEGGMVHDEQVLAHSEEAVPAHAQGQLLRESEQVVVLQQESEVLSQDEERKHAGEPHGVLHAEHTCGAGTFATEEAAADAAVVEVDAAHAVGAPLDAAGVAAVGVDADVDAGVVAGVHAAEVVSDASDEPLVAHASDVGAGAVRAAVDAGAGWPLPQLRPPQLWEEEVVAAAVAQGRQLLIEPLVCFDAAELRLLQLSQAERPQHDPLQALLVQAGVEVPLELEVVPPRGVDAEVLAGQQQQQEQAAWAGPHSGLARQLGAHTVAGCVGASERSTVDEISEHAGAAEPHMHSTELDLDPSLAWQLGS